MILIFPAKSADCCYLQWFVQVFELTFHLGKEMYLYAAGDIHFNPAAKIRMRLE